MQGILKGPTIASFSRNREVLYWVSKDYLINQNRLVPTELLPKTTDMIMEAMSDYACSCKRNGGQYINSQCICIWNRDRQCINEGHHKNRWICLAGHAWLNSEINKAYIYIYKYVYETKVKICKEHMWEIIRIHFLKYNHGWDEQVT